MHHNIATWRPVALVAIALGMLVAFGSLAPAPRQAAAGVIDLTGVYCTDVYLNFSNAAKGQPHEPGVDVLAAKSLTRIEPSQSQAGGWDITQVLYFGPIGADQTPDEPVSVLSKDDLTPILCQEKSTTAAAGAEKGHFNPNINFGNGTTGDSWWSNRAHATAKLVGNQLTWSVCFYSEATSVWIRQDYNWVMNIQGPGTKNFGEQLLHLGTTSPPTTLDKPNEATDPSLCDDQPGTIQFPSIEEIYQREATTDHPTTNPADKNFGIATDPDGPNQPKVKGEDQLPDADTLADDWDGDGCPDWDELDKNFNHDNTFVTQPAGYTGLNATTVPLLSGPPKFDDEQNGIDPFNPNDCDSNYSGISHIIATATPNMTKCTGVQSINSLPACDGTGVYFFACIAQIEHDKNKQDLDGGGDPAANEEALITTLQCYTNSASVTVNFHGIAANGGDVGTCPPAPADRCGGGQKGRGVSAATAYLAGPFTDIQPGVLRTVLQGAGNYYDQDTNTLYNNGCFDNVKGLLGPAIWTQSVVDAHTGVGYVNIWTQLSSCVKPTEPPALPLGFHAKLETIEQGSAATQDTDKDGCTDATELNDAAGSQQNGGIRDPWNYWDFFDMDFDGSIGFTDFLELLQHYGSDDAGGTATVNRDSHPIKTPETGLGIYHPRFDRGNSIPGANGWNENAADGSIGFNDFLSLLRQYTHACA